MEVSFNYGLRRYFISDNYFYLLVFIFSLIVFLKQKQKKQKRKPPISRSLNSRGGDNSVILQKLYDQCLSTDWYVQVKDSKVKQIIRRMLDIADNKPIIISAPLYLAAVLQKKHAPLILQSGGTQLIVSNFRGFMSKGVGTILFAKLLAVGSGPILMASIPLILTALVYSHSHVDCNSLVDPLPKIERIEGSFQYIDNSIKDDGPIIIAPDLPDTSKPSPLFEETEVSSFSSLSCYFRDNCLGPESIPRKSPAKTKNKRFVPLSERTKTLKDLKSPIDPMDAIDVNNVKYKQKTKERN